MDLFLALRWMVLYVVIVVYYGVGSNGCVDEIYDSILRQSDRYLQFSQNVPNLDMIMILRYLHPKRSKFNSWDRNNNYDYLQAIPISGAR